MPGKGQWDCGSALESETTPEGCGLDGFGMTHSILNELDYGLLVVGRQGRILLRNEAARRELATGGLLDERGGGIVVDSACEALPFAAAMERARNGVREVVVLKARQRTLACAMIPLAREAREPGAVPPESGLVLLILGRNRLCSPLTIVLFSRRLGLTSAETAVLGALSSGLDPANIAAVHRVDISTIRTQLLSIRSKLDAPNLRRLIERIAQLPPVVARVHDCS